MSASEASMPCWRVSMEELSHARVFSRATSSGSSLLGMLRPILEKVLIFASRSHALNCSILASMLRRASSMLRLSRTSLMPCHVLIWSRMRCSFLISVFSSPWKRSFRLCEDALCSLSHMVSKSSMPSVIFLHVRSISATSFLFCAIARAVSGATAPAVPVSTPERACALAVGLLLDLLCFECGISVEGGNGTDQPS